ncbi:MAG: phosphoribosyltransferase family protein [Candidatus Woesearchaeota archaeon]
MKRYNKYRVCTSEYGLAIDELILKIEKNQDFFFLRNAYPAALQLYYDGLIEKSGYSWNKHEKVLNELYSALQGFFGAYYNKDRIRFNFYKRNAREAFLDNRKLIIEYSNKNVAKHRHLEGMLEDVIRSFRLLKDISKNWKFDSLVPIASGGFEPGFAAYYIYPEANFFSVRYSSFSRGDEDVLIPSEQPFGELSKAISHSDVLLIDDIIYKGDTLRSVYSFAVENGAKRVFCLAVNMQTEILKNRLVLKEASFEVDNAVFSSNRETWFFEIVDDVSLRI